MTVALSSDAPVVENDSPLAGMQAAMLRRDAEGEPIAAAEAITIDEALDAYTRGGAVASGDDGERGAPAPGMLRGSGGAVGRHAGHSSRGAHLAACDQTWVGGQCKPGWMDGSSSRRR